MNGYVPVRIDSKAELEHVDRVPIFYIDEKEYTAPARVSPGVALDALALAVSLGWQVATWFMVKEALGAEAYTALSSCPALNHEHVRLIFEELSRMYFSQVEDLGKE